MEMFARAEPTKVLMIDDDIELSQMTSELLLREGIQTHCAVTAALGMAALATYQPDVLLLDLMLPDANGLDVCRRLRESGNELPILMLTARGDPIDRVLGLELGADDYLAKPFEPRELVARVRALARRVRVFTKRTQLQFDGLSLDVMARRAICTDPAEREPQILQLTSNEFKLLVALASQPGITVSRDALSAAVQPGSYMPERFVTQAFFSRCARPGLARNRLGLSDSRTHHTKTRRQHVIARCGTGFAGAAVFPSGVRIDYPS